MTFKCPHCGVTVPMGENDWPLVCVCGAVTKSPDDRTVPGKSRGLGDTIAYFTTAIGIKPCGGCKERQEMLNKLVPYRE